MGDRVLAFKERDSFGEVGLEVVLGGRNGSGARSSGGGEDLESRV